MYLNTRFQGKHSLISLFYVLITEKAIQMWVAFLFRMVLNKAYLLKIVVVIFVVTNNYIIFVSDN